MKYDHRQIGIFEPPKLNQLPTSVSNDAEERAPTVRVTEHNIEYVNVSSKNESYLRPFSISITRQRGSAMLELTFTHSQMKHIVIQASKLLGVIAVDLDELDDYEEHYEE